MDPNIIESRNFFITVRGYDRSDVRSFLKEVAAYCRRLETAPAERSPEATVAPYQALGTHVASVLEAAERSAEAIIKQAQDQAHGMVVDAKADAEHARLDEEERLRAVRHELEARESELERVTEEAKRRAEDLDRMAEATGADAAALAHKTIWDARDGATTSDTRRDAAREELARLLDRLRSDLDPPSVPLIDLRDERRVEPDSRVDT